MGVLEALAAALSSRETMRALRDDPQALGNQFGLSKQEVSLLRQASPAGLENTVSAVNGSLLDAVRVIMPLTFDEVQAHYPSAADAFAALTVRPARPEDPACVLTEGELFLSFMTGLLPQSVVEFGRYEFLRHCLSRDRVAAEASRLWEQNPPDVIETIPPPKDMLAAVPVLAATSRIASFTHDVTAGSAPHVMPQKTTCILLRRLWRQRMGTYRVGGTTHELIAACDGTRTAHQVAATAGAPPAQTVALLASLAKTGAITLLSQRLDPLQAKT
ncbi:hypothetical protein [Streptomyces sp. NPDC055709]